MSRAERSIPLPGPAEDHLAPARTGRGRRTLRKISHIDQADANAVNVTLFRNAKNELCGWFIGPLSFRDGAFVLPYLSKSEETMASLAVVRALEAAGDSRRPVGLIDPENLWATIWHG